MPSPTLALDLFGEPEPAPVIGVDLAVSEDRGVVTAHIPGFETMAPETQKAVGDVVKSIVARAQEIVATKSREELPGHVKAADTFALGRLEDFNPHAYAFVAQARHYGHTDPSLTPVSVSPAGRREFDLKAIAQYANWLLRGVRSDRPEMTAARWGEAIAQARETGVKS